MREKGKGIKSRVEDKGRERGNMKRKERWIMRFKSSEVERGTGERGKQVYLCVCVFVCMCLGAKDKNKII